MKHVSCSFCDKVTHFSFQCYRNPKRQAQRIERHKTLAKRGKVARGWVDAKRRWYLAHAQESYNCHYCGKFLLREQVELDHFESRSRRPDLRYELSNLVPSCHNCNTEKGSRSGNEYRTYLSSLQQEN